jgi:hypothetical protein
MSRLAMNENYPPFRLPRPEISDRRPEKPRFVPLAAEAVARRQEVARLLGAKIDAVSKRLRHLSDDQRKAIFVKLEHEGTLDLAGTGLKPITQSDHLTLAVPRGDDLAPLAKKVDRFGSGPLNKGQPENAMLVTRLTDIQPGKPTDRLSEELFRDYAKLIKKKMVILEIEIISLESYQSKQRAAIESALVALEALLKRDEPYGALFEHEEIRGTCRAVIRCSGKTFKQLVEAPEWQTRIAWFDGRPQFETFISTYENFNVDNLGPILSPPQTAPTVCIVDTGITAENPFLKPVVREELFRSFLAAEKDNPYDQHGHGSGVASLAAYYALNLADGATNQGQVWVASARVLDRNNEGDNRLFSLVLREVVETFVPLGVRIFNLSVGIKNRLWNAEGKRTIARSSWIARTIDKLSREYDVVFVVATGNIFNSAIGEWTRGGKPYPAYFAEEAARMLDPGQSALALTVGSAARGTLAIGPRVATAIAEQFQPSPFSRTGPGVRKEIKPDLVEYAGNTLKEPESDIIRSNLGTDVMMASHLLTPAVAHNVGTSFAAPRVSNRLALLLSDLESIGIEPISANLLKAFIVNSAAYSGENDEFKGFVQALDGIKPKHWLNVLGHGVPDEVRATYCDDFSAVLYFQGAIEPNKVAIFDVPIPVCLAEAGSKIKRLTATVVSSPEVQRWGLEEYFGTSMKWRLFRGDVDRSHIVDMMSSSDDESEPNGGDPEASVEEEDGGDQSGRPKELKCKLGIMQRSRGTIQHDIAEWSTHKPEFSSNPYTLAVAAYKRWGTQAVPFSVVIRIEDTARKASVYAGVQEILATIEAQVRPGT